MVHVTIYHILLLYLLVSLILLLVSLVLCLFAVLALFLYFHHVLLILVLYLLGIVIGRLLYPLHLRSLMVEVLHSAYLPDRSHLFFVHNPMMPSCS